MILRGSSTENQSFWGSSSLVKTVRNHQDSWMERGWSPVSNFPCARPPLHVLNAVWTRPKTGCAGANHVALKGNFSCFFRLQLPQLKSGFGWGSFFEYQNLDKDGLDEGATNSDWLSAIGARWRKLSSTHRHTCVCIHIYIYNIYLNLYAIAVYYCHIIMLHYTIFAHVPSPNMLFSTYFHVLSACESSYVFKYMWSLGAFAYHDPIF